MKEEINVEEIWQSVLHSYDMYIDYDVRGHSAIITAMKILANKVLDLAAENATTTRISYFDGTESQQLNGIDIWEEDSSVPCYLSITDKDSILQIKDWIK